jgi:transcriptional regulator with XRE-family HTH domain
MTLKTRIKELANAKGLSLPNLESELGFGSGTIVKWDKSTPNVDKLQKVANYLGVSIDYLVTGEIEDEQNKIIYEYAKKLLALGMTPEKLEKLVDAVEDIQK